MSQKARNKTILEANDYNVSKSKTDSMKYNSMFFPLLFIPKMWLIIMRNRYKKKQNYFLDLKQLKEKEINNSSSKVEIHRCFGQKCTLIKYILTFKKKNKNIE